MGVRQMREIYIYERGSKSDCVETHLLRFESGAALELAAGRISVRRPPPGQGGILCRSARGGGTCVSATNDRAVRDSEGEGPAGPELEKCLKVIDLSMWIVYAREQGSDEEGIIEKRNSCLFFIRYCRKGLADGCTVL